VSKQTLAELNKELDALFSATTKERLAIPLRKEEARVGILWNASGVVDLGDIQYKEELTIDLSVLNRILAKDDFIYCRYGRLFRAILRDSPLRTRNCSEITLGNRWGGTLYLSIRHLEDTLPLKLSVGGPDEKL